MMNTTADFADDYALLGAPSSCDLEQLRLCYRRAVREVHPDLHPALADDPAAQDRLRALNGAMARLEEHHLQYGRLPLQPLRAASAAAAATAGAGGGFGAPPQTPRVSRPPSIKVGGIKWMLVSAAVALAIYALAPEPAKPPPPPERKVTQVDDEATLGPMTRARREKELALTFGVRIGDSPERVKAILGPPILSGGEVWEYGPSHVVFRDGRVVDWYSSPLKPISVDETSRFPQGR
jgi:hypothetical protein